jgi:alpha-tubulin suppressor-like RCC1 family protein
VGYRRGGSAPSGSGYTKIYSTTNAFVAIKTDGSITAWGQNYGGTGAAPSTGAYTKIYSTAYAFAALKADGSITAWGKPSDGGTTPAPNLANTAGADQIAFIGSAITDITFSNSSTHQF